jgi:hypothetical protein
MRSDDSSKMAKEHLKASKKVLKQVIKSRSTAIAFLQKAGILDKNGELAPPYRNARP